MSGVLLGEENKKNYRRELDKIYAKSNYYRGKYAKKALRMSRISKALELISFSSSVIIAATMSAAISGFIATFPTQKLAIILSSITALINIIIKPFFNPEEFIKLFHASGEFLQIREKAKRLMLQCGALSLDVLRLEYKTLSDEYTNLKKMYIEYIDTPTNYYRNKRNFKVPGKRVRELPPISGTVNKE